MIAGIGVDVVDLARFERSIARTPALTARLFTPTERALPVASLAGRFAAKEALIKALGDIPGFRWADVEIGGDRKGKPEFRFTGAVAAAVAAAGVVRTHLSMSHDAGVAVAMVVLEAEVGA